MRYQVEISFTYIGDAIETEVIAKFERVVDALHYICDYAERYGLDVVNNSSIVVCVIDTKIGAPVARFCLD